MSLVALAVLVANVSEDPQEKDVIVVTASKRPEPLNNAAASIAVLGSEGLEMRSVRTLQDLNGFSPNIQVNGTTHRLHQISISAAWARQITTQTT